MTQSQIPIRDISIMCGQHILDVELTHLHTSIQANGRGKFNSSHHTTVKVAEGQRVVQELEVVGVLENEYGFILLDSLCEEYILSVEMYTGSLEELIERLPFKVSVESVNKRVLKFNAVEASL
ncbi:hypothetical protein Q7C36_005215 [Tachysurus vachellii]|uniref:Uncharacterized protein n=1 Tax=Tachysurus vachellii TaxID=175792 RepID=A0AA88TBY4_TACVA|nr:hypothetical protein Q7C36_005215 [Tachysurus vachellii]